MYYHSFNNWIPVFITLYFTSSSSAAAFSAPCGFQYAAGNASHTFHRKYTGMHCSYLFEMQYTAGNLFFPIFSFGIHRIITAECTRNIHSFWAWHAVTTSCTSHFYIFLISSFTFSISSRSDGVRHPTSDSLAVFTFCSTISMEFMPESTQVTSGWS